MPIFSLAGPSMGKYEQVGGRRVESFDGTPFHAKAMELMADEHEIRAKLRELPMFSSSDTQAEKKVRETNQKKLRAFNADWLRLEADVLRWRAKKIRSEDKMQKGLFGEDEKVANIEKDLYQLSGSPYYQPMLRKLSKYHEISAKIAKNRGKISLEVGKDYEKEKKEEAKAIAEVLKCKADYLKWKAKQVTKEGMAKGQSVIDDLDSAMNILKGNGNSTNRNSVFRGALQLEVEGYRSRYRLAPTPFEDPSHPFSRLDTTINMVKSIPLDAEIDKLSSLIDGE